MKLFISCFIDLENPQEFINYFIYLKLVMAFASIIQVVLNLIRNLYLKILHHLFNNFV